MVTYVYPILHIIDTGYVYMCLGQNKTHTSRVSTTKMTTHIIPMPMREQARESTINGHGKCSIGLQLKECTLCCCDKSCSNLMCMCTYTRFGYHFWSVAHTFCQYGNLLFQIMCTRPGIFETLKKSKYRT